MTITYKDVSHFNGAYKPTGPTCAKATEGTSYVDPQFAGIRLRTRAHAWPFLAYHYLRTSSVAAQAAHVVATIGKGRPIMLDVEKDSGSISNVLAFMDAYAAAGGQVTLVYLPHWYWSSIGSPSLAGIKTRHAGLVSSNYPPHGYTESGPGWDAYGGMTPIVWQYTSTPIDTNAYKGTEAALADLWANGTSGHSNPSQPVQPPSEDDVGTVDTFSPAAIKQLLESPINGSGLTFGVALQNGTADVLLKSPINGRGQTVSQVLESTNDGVTQLLTVLDAPALATLVASAVALLPSGIDVNEQTLQTALVGALKELAAENTAPPTV